MTTPRLCSLEECFRQVHRRELCRKHYREDRVRRGEMPVCEIPGCGKWVRRRNRCHGHGGGDSKRRPDYVYPTVDFECTWCSSIFQRRWLRKYDVVGKQFCTHRCSDEWHRARYGEDHYQMALLDRRRKARDRRRARIKGVGYENFNRSEIFDRDGWVCQLCHEPVDRAVKWPDNLSATLDHIKPLSKQGPHTRANVQLAHLGCNTRKGNREE